LLRAVFRPLVLISIATVGLGAGLVATGVDAHKQTAQLRASRSVLARTQSELATMSVTLEASTAHNDTLTSALTTSTDALTEAQDTASKAGDEVKAYELCVGLLLIVQKDLLNQDYVAATENTVEVQADCPILNGSADDSSQ